MSEPANPPYDGELDAYLDGALDARRRADFEETLRSDASRRRQVELQQRIDASLVAKFRAQALTDRDLGAVLAQARRDSSRTLGRKTRLGWAAAILALAACLGWLAAANPLSRPPTENRFFTSRPLAELYLENVANGFEPGYSCEEADRFAETFERRQGVPLKLLRLPRGIRMLGLAYLGGLTPETTAMLGIVDGKQVMVFVDRTSADRPDASTSADRSLHVFRDERNGLVFYEVTPLDRPRLTEFLAPTDVEGSGELPESKPSG